MKRKLVAAIACRNQGTRLYGKPLQNLDIENNVTILDNIIACLKSLDCISEIVLGISEGLDNKVYSQIAEENNLKYIYGDEQDVLSRLVECGKVSGATDIFRVTSESPFLYFEPVMQAWQDHISGDFDATFLDNIIDGCGFEIIRLSALQKSHECGSTKHRSELCTLYIREHKNLFNINIINPPEILIRKDLRLTVDYPEDLIVCRNVYKSLKNLSPKIPVSKIVEYLDNNPGLIELTYDYTGLGYSSMYV